MVESARLLSGYTPKGYRGFESRSLRHVSMRDRGGQIMSKVLIDSRFEFLVERVVCASSCHELTVKV